MKRLCALVHAVLLVTTPSLLAHPPFAIPYVVQQSSDGGESHILHPSFTYDEFLQFLEEVESGVFEDKCSPEQLEQLVQFIAFVARQGALPDGSAEALEDDIAELLDGDNLFERASYRGHEYFLAPAIWHPHMHGDIVQCGGIRHVGKKVGRFVKKHKKELIIGVVIIIVVGAVTVAVVASSAAGVASAAAAAASAAGAAAASPVPSSHEDTAMVQLLVDGQVASLKEELLKENFFDLSPSSFSLPPGEVGRTVGVILGHDSLTQLTSDPHFIQPRTNTTLSDIERDLAQYGLREIDKRFATQYGPTYCLNQDTDVTTLLYQVRGDVALSSGYYTQAINDFSKAIELNPKDPTPYLHRSTSYFNTGQYAHSLADFQKFTSHIEKPHPFSGTEFTRGFAKGLPKGIYESGEGIMLFLAELVTHPIHTATQMYEAISLLADLTRREEWKMIGEALSPEIHELVTQWHTLPSERKGELAGYALGKHGADILAPGALAKIASKSAKSAQELVAILKNLERVEETLVLETAAGIGNSAKLGEIVGTGREMAFLGEELGFTAQEMGRLQKTGKLENTLQDKLKHLSLPKQESVELFVEAEKYLRSYKGFMPEQEVRNLIHQTGIPTFPRPKGIPENYRVKLSNSGAGMKYVHPSDEGTYVRVMPGKAHSNNPCQQKPYVNHRVHGESVDKFGRKVLNDSIESHIPLAEFIYRDFYL